MATQIPPVALTDAEEEKLLYDAVMANYAKTRKKIALDAANASKATKEATFCTENEVDGSIPNGAKRKARRRAMNLKFSV